MKRPTRCFSCESEDLVEDGDMWVCMTCCSMQIEYRREEDDYEEDATFIKDSALNCRIVGFEEKQPEPCAKRAPREKKEKKKQYDRFRGNRNPTAPSKKTSVQEIASIMTKALHAMVNILAEDFGVDAMLLSDAVRDLWFGYLLCASTRPEQLLRVQIHTSPLDSKVIPPPSEALFLALLWMGLVNCNCAVLYVDVLRWLRTPREFDCEALIRRTLRATHRFKPRPIEGRTHDVFKRLWKGVVSLSSLRGVAFREGTAASDIERVACALVDLGLVLKKVHASAYIPRLVFIVGFSDPVTARALTSAATNVVNMCYEEDQWTKSRALRKDWSNTEVEAWQRFHLDKRAVWTHTPFGNYLRGFPPEAVAAAGVIWAAQALRLAVPHKEKMHRKGGNVQAAETCHEVGPFSDEDGLAAMWRAVSQWPNDEAIREYVMTVLDGFAPTIPSALENYRWCWVELEEGFQDSDAEEVPDWYEADGFGPGYVPAPKKRRVSADPVSPEQAKEVHPEASHAPPLRPARALRQRLAIFLRGLQQCSVPDAKHNSTLLNLWMCRLALCEEVIMDTMKAKETSQMNKQRYRERKGTEKKPSMFEELRWKFKEVVTSYSRGDEASSTSSSSSSSSGSGDSSSSSTSSSAGSGSSSSQPSCEALSA